MSETITPEVAVRDIHALGAEFGFRKVRIDRSAFGGSDGPECWFEVGYASQEIHVRTSNPNLPQYRAAVGQVDMDSVTQLMIDLIDYTYPTPEVQP